ncbi:trigger factor [Candidatus Falkowbacteria bacterium]|nr:trigger factor [Candidatus Falkowbacteria bacterium]
MSIVKKNFLPKSQLELTVELMVEEFKPYIEKGAEAVAREIKIEGFRPGKAPYEIVKAKVGEMTILEEAARLAINKTIDQAIRENLDGKEAVGQPQVNITKLAPSNPLEYKIVLAILPEIKLGDYKNLKIEKSADAFASDEEVEKMIHDLREMRVKEIIVDREIKEGDKAIIDIQIFLDKVPVEGGQGKGAAVVVGKNYIIPGFDKNLINARKGEIKEFSLPYPTDYHLANLVGKVTEFKVEIKEVYERQLPALDDEFAASFSAKKIDELKHNIKHSLEAEKKQQAEQRAEIEMLDKILAKTKFGDIAEILVNHEADPMLHELEHDVTAHGGKFDDYLAAIKKTRDQLILDLLPQAVKRVKTALVIREIATREKIEVSEKEVEEKVEELLKQYRGYAKVEERVKEPGYKSYLRNILTNRKVIEKLKEWNVGK